MEQIALAKRDKLQSLKLLWIPSHVGIIPNAYADAIADAHRFDTPEDAYPSHGRYAKLENSNHGAGRANGAFSMTAGARPVHDLVRDGIQRWIVKRFAGYDDSGDWRLRDLPLLDWDNEWSPNLDSARREASKWTAVIRISSSGGEGQHSSTNPSALGTVMMLRAEKFPIAGALTECPICNTAWDKQPFAALRHALQEVWGPSAQPDPEENAHNSAGLYS